MEVVARMGNACTCETDDGLELPPTAIGERVRAPLPLPFTILYWGCRATVEPLRILTTEGRSLLHITQRGPPDSDS